MIHVTVNLVDRVGDVPCGETHWTDPVRIDIRRRSTFGEFNALLHELAHVISDEHEHGPKFVRALETLVALTHTLDYPWAKEILQR